MPASDETNSADDVALARYHRQTLLPGFGADGQRRLGAAHAVIVGVGALGCVSADALARAGVGRLTLIDRDIVELTNLQRQTLYTEADAAARSPKAAAAAARLRAINSAIDIEPVVADVNSGNAEALLGVVGEDRPRPTVILDGTDNFQTRLLINDVCVKHGVPWMYAGAVSTRGVVAAVLPKPMGNGAPPWTPGPCLRCVMPEAPAAGDVETCDTAGVLGPVVSAVASLQSIEAMKIMLGAFDAVRRELVSLDTWDASARGWSVLSLPPDARDPACPCCGEHRFDALNAVSAGQATSLCGRGAMQVSPASFGATVDLPAMASRLEPMGEVTATRFFVRARLAGERGESGEGVELTVFPDGRAIVQGVTEPSRARALYARYVGV